MVEENQIAIKKISNGQFLQEFKVKVKLVLFTIWQRFGRIPQFRKLSMSQIGQLVPNYSINIWIQICAWICSLNLVRLYLVSKTTCDKYCLLKWVRETIINSGNSNKHGRIQRMITNFGADWRDGTVLCALLDALHPGACPRHDLLHPKQEHLNIEVGLKLARTHFGINMEMNVYDFQMMDEDAEYKLLQYISKLHSVVQRRHQKRIESTLVKSGKDIAQFVPEVILTADQHSIINVLNPIPTTPTVACFAKGMGLVLAVVNRMSRFNIYLQTNDYMDIVIEIEGPENEFCTKRVTIRSSRKSNAFATNESEQHHDDDMNEPINLTTGRQLTIPMEYEVTPGKISVGYTPQLIGLYKLSIISKGQHITGSPYTIDVNEPSSLNEPPRQYDIGSTTINRLEHQDSGDVEPVPVTDNGEKIIRPQPGRVIRRKILRSIVYRNEKQVVLNGDEPLPPDPRAWSSSLDDHSPEVARYQTVFEDSHMEDSSFMSTPTLDLSFNKADDDDDDDEEDVMVDLKSIIPNESSKTIDCRPLVIQQRAVNSCPTSQIFLNSNEYDDFWNENHESIVKIRLKEWEEATVIKSNKNLKKVDFEESLVNLNRSQSQSQSRINNAPKDIMIIERSD